MCINNWLLWAYILSSGITDLQQYLSGNKEQFKAILLFKNVVQKKYCPSQEYSVAMKVLQV